MRAPNIAELVTLSITTSLFILFLIVLALLLIKAFISRGKEQVDARQELLSHGLSSLVSEMKALREEVVVKERLAALGEISAAIIHQVRNPTAVIAGYAKLLYRSMDPEDPKRAYAEGILKEIETMEEIMEGLLLYSKAIALKKETVDLSKLIREAAKDAIEKGSKVSFDLPEIKVTGDRKLLLQAFKNLIQNASEAGDQISISSLQDPSSRVINLQISDNGPGIREDDQKKVFLPFFSLKESGIGIGLSLTQRIIQSHGGSVSIKESGNMGTTFLITLPRA